MPYKDPEKQREYHRLYMRARYQRDPEAGATRVREARQANPEKTRKERMRNWNSWKESSPHRAWAAGTLGNHRHNKYQIKITTPELTAIAETISHCKYCGSKLDYFPLKGRPGRSTPSLDRINNGKVIDAHTIQIICKECNTTKLERTHNEFVNYCKNIVAKFGAVA